MEKLIYFYPAAGQGHTERESLAAIRRRLQKPALAEHELGGCGALEVAGCAVPPFYYRYKAWKPARLQRVMEETLRRYGDGADVWLHPQIVRMLPEDAAARFRPRPETVRTLIGHLVNRYAPAAIGQCKEAAVLLGGPGEAGEQMRLTDSLLKPYMEKINRLTVFYQEEEENACREIIEEELDGYYYEYGLVAQVQAYTEAADGFRCGRNPCGGLILDYCAQYRYPKLTHSTGLVYVDTVSAADKQMRLTRTALAKQYVSPSKYLDTMVKNSYDRLVN